VEVMPFARIRLRHRLRSPGFVLVTSVPPLETQSANPRRSTPNSPAEDHLERAGLETLPLEGLRLADVGEAAHARHWLRGGFPLSFTARSEVDSLAWRRNFLQTFLERDLRQMGVQIPALALRRFWNMVAHYHGQTWNGAELARALSVNESTVRRYLALMTGVFMVRQLPPWFENSGKRQVKAPKIYVRDSGLLHALLGVTNARDLEHHPKVGASWEGYAIEEVLKALRPDDAYYWATYNDAEIDLLLFKDSKRIGVEQADGRSQTHPVDADRPHGSEARPSVGRVSRRAALCPRRQS